MLTSYGAMIREDLEAAATPDAFQATVAEARKLIHKMLPLYDEIEEAFASDPTKLDLVLDWLDGLVPSFLVSRLGQSYTRVLIRDWKTKDKT